MAQKGDGYGEIQTDGCQPDDGYAGMRRVRGLSGEGQ